MSTGERAYLAHPQHSLKAQRKGPDKAWEVRDEPGLSPERAYWQSLAACDQREPSVHLAAFLLVIGEELTGFGDTSGVVVSRLARVTENGRPLVRIRLEDRARPALMWRSCTVELAADDHLAVRSYELENRDGEPVRGEFAYDRHEGLPVLRERRAFYPGRDGTTSTGGLKVVARDFGPVPETEFTPARLLDGPSIRKIPPDADPHPESFNFARWYGVPIVAGGLCLVGGLAIALGTKAGR